MIIRKILMATATTIPLVVISTSSYATNGMESMGLGQIHKGMGGAAVANPLNTSSIASNPASINNIEAGYDVGAAIFNPDRTSTRKAGFGETGPMSATKNFSGNKREYFLIPEAGYKKRSNGNMSFGIVAYGSGGMNTHYNGSDAPTLITPQGPAPFNSDGLGGTTGNDSGLNLMQLVIAPTIGYKFNEKHSVGLSANLTHQRFKAYGISLFQNPAFTTDPSSVSDRGYDSSSGIGATLGWQGKFSDKLTMGLAYRTKTGMGKFDKYKGLFPNGGELDLPAAVSVGIGLKPTPKTTIAFDIKRIYYSNVAGIGNSSTIIPGQRLIGDDVGFGWEDQTIYKLGIKQQINSSWSLLAGVNYGKNPVPSDGTNLNVLAPGVTETHISLGFEKKLGKGASITGNYVRSLSSSLEGNAATMPIPQNYDLEMNQHAFGIAYSKKF